MGWWKTTNQNQYIDSAFLVGGAANRITLQQELEFAEFFGTKYRRTFPSPSAVSSAMQLGCLVSCKIKMLEVRGWFRIRYRYVGIHDRDRWRGVFVDVFSKFFIFNMDLVQLGWFRSYVLRYSLQVSFHSPPVTVTVIWSRLDPKTISLKTTKTFHGIVNCLPLLKKISKHSCTRE